MSTKLKEYPFELDEKSFREFISRGFIAFLAFFTIFAPFVLAFSWFRKKAFIKILNNSSLPFYEKIDNIKKASFWNAIFISGVFCACCITLSCICTSVVYSGYGEEMGIKTITLLTVITYIATIIIYHKLVEKNLLKFAQKYLRYGSSYAADTKSSSAEAKSVFKESYGDQTIDDVEEITDAPMLDTDNLKHSILLVNINQQFTNEKITMYEATRKYWRLSPDNANKVDYVITEYKSVLHAIFKVDKKGWQKSEEHDGRYFFEGKEVKDARILSLYLHKGIVKPRGQSNPIRYFMKKGA